MAIFVKTLAPGWYPKIAGFMDVYSPKDGNFIEVLTHPQINLDLDPAK